MAKNNSLTGKTSPNFTTNPNTSLGGSDLPKQDPTVLNTKKPIKTNEEILNSDPLDLTSGEKDRWRTLQKEVILNNKVYLQQYKDKQDQEELQLRDAQIKAEFKLAHLNNLKYSIEIENIYPDYDKAMELGKVRVKAAQEQAQKDQVAEFEAHQSMMAKFAEANKNTGQEVDANEDIVESPGKYSADLETHGATLNRLHKVE